MPHYVSFLALPSSLLFVDFPAQLIRLLLQGLLIFFAVTERTGHHVAFKVILKLFPRLGPEAHLTSEEFPRFLRLSRKRCFSSAHACQYPRLRCRSSRLLVVRSSRIESAHIPVASTRSTVVVRNVLFLWVSKRLGPLEGSGSREEDCPQLEWRKGGSWLLALYFPRASLWPEGVSHLPPCQAPQRAQRARHEVPVDGHTPRRPSSRIELPALPSAPLLASLVVPLGSLSPCLSPPSTRFVPRLFVLDASLGTSMVACDLRPCVSADHEYFGALRDPGVDEEDVSFCGFAETDSFVDSRTSLTTLVWFVQDRLRARHRRLHPLLAPSCPVFWPQAPSSCRHTISVRTRTPSNALTCRSSLLTSLISSMMSSNFSSGTPSLSSLGLLHVSSSLQSSADSRHMWVGITFLLAPLVWRLAFAITFSPVTGTGWRDFYLKLSDTFSH